MNHKYVLSFIFILSIVYTGCKQKESVLKNPVMLEAERAAASVKVNSDSCSCLTSYQIASCTNNSNEASIINQFLNNQPYVIKTINWGVCTTSPYIKDDNCNAPYNNGTVTSQLILCWHSCKTVSAKIINPPPCLPCYPNEFCMILEPHKEKNNGSSYWVLVGSTSVFNALNIRIYISSDPDIDLSCSYYDTQSNQTVIFNCYGSY